MELNDGPVLRTTGDIDYFARICKLQFDQLYREGAESGRVMCIAIHPCWTGQPHRIRALLVVVDWPLPPTPTPNPAARPQR